MVHRRIIDGQEIVFGNQGALWGNAMTWWDHDTGSIWSQPLGEAIAGPRKGERLDPLPVELTSWDSWRLAHPDTVALSARGGRSGFDLADMSIALNLGTEQVAWAVPPLRSAGVVNDVVAGIPVAALFDPADRERWVVFSRQLDDLTVELGIDGGRIVDAETGSVWDPISGRALSGPLEGETLDTLAAFTTFPADFDTFWPEGRHWP